MEDVITINKDMGYFYGELTNSLILAEMFAENGQYKMAYELQRIAQAMKDSVYNDETKEMLLEKKMEFEQKLKEATLKTNYEARISRQKLIQKFILAGLILVVLVSIMIVKLLQSRKKAREAEMQALYEVDLADSENKALRSQMNPHFIFNALNSIAQQISNQDAEKADHYLASFARLMRQVLENSNLREVPIEDDLKALQLYLELEKMRTGHAFNYEILVDPAIDPATTYIPPLLLQPFVENSIWHGFADSTRTGQIKIGIKKKNNQEILCTVEDNGIGREASGAKQQPGNAKTSLGMTLTNKRLNLLNKINKTKASIVETDLEQGFRIDMTLPLLID